jgi:hypothetical protein
VVVCNADEGEPGTFKDRVLLTRHADAVVEGMSIAAWLIGARQGLVYLRGEYRYHGPCRAWPQNDNDSAMPCLRGVMTGVSRKLAEPSPLATW